MNQNKLTRRNVLSRCLAILGGLVASGKVTAATRTPKTTEGPFYPKPSMRFDDIDNDLVKVEGKVSEAGGEILHLSGVIYDSKTGTPCPQVRVEIWQCDMNGKYLHTGDKQNIDYDTGFQGFGHDITDESGAFSFRTIVPAKYPGRTPHIHVKILNEKKAILTSQLYIKDNAQNDVDGIYRRMSEEQASSVSMDFKQSDKGLEAAVTLVV